MRRTETGEAVRIGQAIIGSAALFSVGIVIVYVSHATATGGADESAVSSLMRTGDSFMPLVFGGGMAVLGAFGLLKSYIKLQSIRPKRVNSSSDSGVSDFDADDVLARYLDRTAAKEDAPLVSTMAPPPAANQSATRATGFGRKTS
jgi:hypothetical protein